MIKELLRKDGVILNAMLIAGLVAHFAYYADGGFERLWIWPNTRMYEDAFVLHYIFGIALGLLVALRDEVTRTQEFLWHRPVSRQRVFATRILASFAIMICWLVLALWGVWIWFGWGNPNKLVAVDGRMWLYLAYGTVTFVSFSAGYFAASWPGHWALRFTLGAMPALLILLLCFGEPFPYTNPATHPAIAAVVLLAATAILLSAAWWNERAGRDPDHPISTPALRWSVTLAATAGCLLWAPGMREVQKDYSNSVRRWYPAIAQNADGTHYLRGLNPATWPDDYEYMILDEHHGVVAPAPELDPELPRPCWPHHASQGWTRGWHDYRRPGLVLVGLFTHHTRCFLDPATGYAYLITTTGPGEIDRKPNRRTLAKGPEKQRFSRSAKPVGRSWDKLAMILDENVVWGYDLKRNADHFHRIPLPNDDRVVQWTIHSSRATPLPVLDDRRLVVFGEKAVYGWNGTDFVEIEYSKRPRQSRPRVKATINDVDPFTFTAVVAGEDGKVAFRHRYDIHTWHELLPAMVVYAASLVRIPVLQVQSFCHSDARLWFSQSEYTDPLLAGHKRFWLLALNLLVAGILAALAVRRLRCLGAPRGRVLSWAVAIAAGGVPLFLYYRFIETNRAWRRAPILKPEEIPPMWIQSA